MPELCTPGMNHQSHRAISRRSLALLASTCVVVALVLTACGGGSSSSSSTATTAAPAASGASGRGFNAAAMKAFYACMTQHGVTITVPTTTPGETFPTPPAGASGGGSGFGGGGRGFGGGAGLAALTNNPAFQACESQLPAGTLQRLQQRQQEDAAFISCMNDNGVTITTSGPGGAAAAIRSLDKTSPAYIKCSAVLPSGGTFGPGGGSTTTTTP